jgi:hypothetical protein
VFDTLAQCMAGGEENSATEMGRAIEACSRLRLRFGCSVLALHHTGWDTTRERGSSALRAAADATISAERVAGEQRPSLILRSVKVRDDEAFADLYFDLPTIDLGERGRSLRLAVRDSKPVETQGAVGDVLDIWSNDLDEVVASASEAGRRLGLDMTKDRHVAGRRMARLIDLGYVGQPVKVGPSLTYSLTAKGRDLVRTNVELVESDPL